MSTAPRNIIDGRTGPSEPDRAGPSGPAVGRVDPSGPAYAEGRAGHSGPAAAEVRQRLALAVGAALLAAGLILVMFVLPAEFAVDPLGTGARFGLLPLGVVGQQVEQLNKDAAAAGGTAQGAILVAQEKPFQQESVDF